MECIDQLFNSSLCLLQLRHLCLTKISNFRFKQINEKCYFRREQKLSILLSITIAFLPLSSANIIYVLKYSFDNGILFLKKFKPRQIAAIQRYVVFNKFLHSYNTQADGSAAAAIVSFIQINNVVNMQNNRINL